MDSRDSTSSSPMNVVREGADDDGALSVTAMLAKEAFMFFQSDKFSECVDVLHQLLQKKEGDPKVYISIFFCLYHLWFSSHFILCVI